MKNVLKFERHQNDIARRQKAREENATNDMGFANTSAIGALPALSISMQGHRESLMSQTHRLTREDSFLDMHHDERKSIGFF
jgi:hypothetical protein